MLTFLRARSSLFWFSTVGVVLLTVLLAAPAPVVEVLWMRSLGYDAVFWTILRTRSLLFLAAFAAVAVFLAGNFYVVLRHFPVLRWLNLEGGRGGPRFGDLVLTPPMLRIVAAAVTLFAAVLFGLSFSAGWETFVRFGGSGTTGRVDPIFGRDVAFYLLQLPFAEMVQNGLAVLALLGLLLVGGGYMFLGNVGIVQGRLTAPRRVALHLAVNASLLLAAWGWGFYLDRYALLYGRGGLVAGAGYIDVHYVLPALWAMVVGSVVLIGLVLYAALANRVRWLVGGASAYALLAALGLFIVPALVQSLRVEPNELQLETPYLLHNIEMTRAAYAIDRVREEPYPGRADLTAADLTASEATLQNIRLWDPRLLIQTFRQLQEIRLYYQFYDVDIDRYMLDSVYTQVMLSARELEEPLPERTNTWVNRHLQYTHGYGFVMTPVAQRGNEGSPLLLARDIPPVVEGGLRIDQPAIYFGEHTPAYRIVNTEVPELDYPQGDENAYTRYAGSGGVVLGSTWRRLLFAWYMSDVNIYLSGYTTAESRILYWSRVQERVHRVAPYLRLDADPYLVVHDGRLLWMQDAYTTASTYPYAEPTGVGVNYIRNSVKAVVDAYEGTVQFYAADPDDPVLGAYREAFPDVFLPMDEMPEGLRAHVRYPEDLFKVQVEKYNRYHMTSPQVFYNNEDLWAVPREHYGGQVVPMEPYYSLMQLPGGAGLEFLLMQPLTPQNRDNMIAWMAVRSDMPGYGEILVYRLPKERLIYGPNQIESRIDQDTEISQQLSLWNRSGSRVIRGNLMVVPVAETFLYVEPVFLIADGTQIPELQRVIAAYGERVVMERSLEEALAVLFGEAIREAAGRAGEGTTGQAGGERPGAQGGGTAANETIERARRTLDRALEALRAGDFGRFGDELETLRRVLDEAGAGQPGGAAAETNGGEAP